MTLIFDNFVAWSAQLAVLIAMGAIAALALAPGRARLYFWQGLLAIALLLPLAESWTAPAPLASGTVATATSVPAVASGPTHAGFQFRRESLLWIVLAGAALRALWIAAGFLRLRRHRLAARPLQSPPVPFESTGIRWYVSDTISGPVTFGWLRPAILLPANVCGMPAELREAIACHEMIHVERRDWLFVLAEEAIRGLFWFHPLVWFALSQIQLAREQSVDAEVVGLMSNREKYLDALVAVAAHKFRAGLSYSDVAPAPLFLKKRQLAMRVAAVLKETRMTKPRLIASFATVGSAALLAARFAMVWFPLQSLTPLRAQSSVNVVGRAPMDGPGITVEAGGPLMHRTGVFRPMNVPDSGTVVLDAVLNASGEVTDARVITGPEELRKYAIQSVLNWHYSIAQGAAPTVRVSIAFAEPQARMQKSKQIASTPRGMEGQTLKFIQFSGVSQDVQDRVLAALPIHEGDALNSSSMEAVTKAAHGVDEHLLASFSNRNGETTLNFFIQPGITGGVISTVQGGVRGGVEGVPQPPSAPLTNGPNPSMVRVGGGVQSANLLKRVQPVYPPLAKQARVSGVVHLTVTIGQNGSVQNIEVIDGHPLLVPAALDAVRQWEYKPTLLNGNPVAVTTQVDVNFSLSDDPQ